METDLQFRAWFPGRMSDEKKKQGDYRSYHLYYT